MNKIILSTTVALFFATSIYANDANCQDKTTFPTVPKQCSCIMTNAVNDCSIHSPIKSICNVDSLGNYFKNNPAGAQAQCQRYGGMPDQCQWSIVFYDDNC